MKLRQASQTLADAAIAVLQEQQPCTLRSVFYQLVSRGHLPSTDAKHYNRLSRLLIKLRRDGVVPWDWIIDGQRETIVPSAWSDLSAYIRAVRRSYRRDPWVDQPVHVAVLVEKYAMAASLAPTTEPYGVPLHVVRGYSSGSYLYEIAGELPDKPAHLFYLGDYDPSGMDLERYAREEILELSDRGEVEYATEPDEITWTRLGVLPGDFEAFDLLPLEVKHSDTRARAFLRDHGERCAEIDALPTVELRRRVQEAITRHIDPEAWQASLAAEDEDRERLAVLVG